MLKILGHFWCSKQIVERGSKRCISSYKMVLVVRKDLKMSKGKIAAQCAHAAVSCFKSSSSLSNTQWKMNNQAKIVLQCENENSLLDIYKKAKENKLPVSLICDAGRTQLTAGTYTVVGIGPASSMKIDNITNHLTLL